MTMYLARKSGHGKVHYWNGRDTACRMASTGGLSMRRYLVIRERDERPICRMCADVSKQQPASEQVSVTELARQRELPPGLVAALGRLSAALGNPKALYTDAATIEEALIDEAARLINRYQQTGGQHP